MVVIVVVALAALVAPAVSQHPDLSYPNLLEEADSFFPHVVGGRRCCCIAHALFCSVLCV